MFQFLLRCPYGCRFVLQSTYHNDLWFPDPEHKTVMAPDLIILALEQYPNQPNNGCNQLHLYT